MSKSTYQTRPLTFDDIPSFIETLRSIALHQGISRIYSTDDIQLEWQEPEFDIESSSLGIFTGKGQLAGFAIVWDTSEIPVHPWIEWGVHPDHRDDNLSRDLLQWADTTSKRVIDRCPPTARLSVYADTIKGYAPGENALKQANFHTIRYWYDMRIDMIERPSIPKIPEDFSIRTYQHEQDLSGLVHAHRDAFSDHFGHVEKSFEHDYDRFQHWLNSDKLFDPSLTLLAIHEATGDIAGYIMARKEQPGDATVSHIQILGVRRDYRKRGLAQALLRCTFNELWDRGHKSVTLDVDGDSLTDAVKLYQRVGMYITHETAQYEKVIREGQELATITVE